MPRPGLPHAARATAVVVVLLTLSFMGGVPAHADTTSRLHAAEARLSVLIKRVASARRAEAALQVQLNALAAKISQVQTEIAQTEALIEQTKADIATAQASIDQRQGALDERARLAYEAGPGSSLEFLLGSTSIADLQDRIELSDAAAQADEDLINQLHDEQNQLRIKQADLQTLQTALRAKQSDLQTHQHALDVKLASAQRLYDAAARAKHQAEAIVKTLKKKAAQEAQSQISQAGWPPSGSGGGPAIGGVLLACPVQGPHGYADDFGAPRPGHIHAGVDIQAGTGTPIVAPFPGNAVRTWDSGGGNGVFVQGSAGYVYNAHLSSYGTLGRVSTGTVIGYVGSTGDATGPHDHFEWHPNVIPANPYVSPYGYSVVGTAIDPYPYLNSVC